MNNSTMFEDDTENDDILQKSSGILLQERPRKADVICFHEGTEEALLIFIENNAKRNDPIDILKWVDRFCYSRHWMMHIGDQKAIHLTTAINEAIQVCDIDKPLICVELGSYCGYSSILIAKDLPERSKLYSIEYDFKCVQWTKRLVSYAGLTDKHSIIHGSLENPETIANLLNAIASDYPDYPFPNIGLLFIDHDKRRYLQDLLIIESSGIMKSGCRVVGDNVNLLGNPSTDYLNHVRNIDGPYQSSRYYSGYIEYSVPTNIEDLALFSEADALKRAQESNPNNQVKTLQDGIEISVYK